MKQKQEAQRLAAEKEDETVKDTLKRKRKSTIVAQKTPTTPKIWDDDGKLIEAQHKPAPANTDPQDDEFAYIAHMAPLSHAILQETTHKSLLEREMDKTKKPKSARRKRSASVIHTDFDSFWERQDKLVTKRNNELKDANKPPKFSSHMDKRSSILARKAKSRPKCKPEPDSCTFKPDLSLTQNVKASGISCVYNEARALMKEVEITAIKVEREAELNRECTLAPEFESDEKLREQAGENRAKILQNNRDRAERIASEVRKAHAKENHVEHVKCAQQLPKRTRRLNSILSILKDDKKKRNC